MQRCGRTARSLQKFCAASSKMGKKENKIPHNFPSLSFKIYLHDQLEVWKAQTPCFITVSESLEWRKGILAIEDEASIKGARGSFHQKFKLSKWKGLW